MTSAPDAAAREVTALVRAAARRAHGLLGHAVGRLTRRYYFEDHVRVYPDGISFTKLGRARPATDDHRRNYANHVKFYRFAAQFAPGRNVADIGCGSGYGCDILLSARAASVVGADVSKASIRFARRRYPDISFTRQTITRLADYGDESFGLTVCSEVLEHVKEYGIEALAMSELVRVTQPGGILVLSTPNTELFPDHGFGFDEMNVLLEDSFDDYVLFENAFIGDPAAWQRRVASRCTGVVVTEPINRQESWGRGHPIKEGRAPGEYKLGQLTIDTTLLHNTHSWVVVALNRSHHAA